MDAQEIINYIATSEKKTPVKLYINETAPIDYGGAKVFGEGRSKVVFGDWKELQAILDSEENDHNENQEAIVPTPVLCET